MKRRMALAWVVGLCVAGSWLEAAVLTRTFSNIQEVTLNQYGGGGAYYWETWPYPSEIPVAGIPGHIEDVWIKLAAVGMGRAGDMNAKVTAPGNRGISLWCESGWDASTIGTFTFNDAYPAMPAADMPVKPGNYRPTNNGGPRVFPAPCPQINYAGSFKDAKIIDGPANGTWQLWAYDSYPQYWNGRIAGGWYITLKAHYNGEEVAAGTDVVAKNEIPPETKGHVNATFFGSTRGGVFAAEYYEMSQGEMDQKIEAGQMPFTVFPKQPEGAKLQYWDVSWDGAIDKEVAVTFRYNEEDYLGYPRERLCMYHYYGGEWHQMLTRFYPGENLILVSTNRFSPFMLGVIPEPGMLGMLGLGAVMLLRGRRRGR
jgi:hypothetical protein